MVDNSTNGLNLASPFNRGTSRFLKAIGTDSNLERNIPSVRIYIGKQSVEKEINISLSRPQSQSDGKQSFILFTSNKF